MRLPFLVALLTIAAAAEAAAQGNKLGVKYRPWRATVEGDALADEAGFVSAELDLESTLDLEDDQIFHDITIWGNLPSIGYARINYWWGKVEGESVLTSSFTWSSTTYFAGDPVESEFDLTGLSILWDYPLAKEKLGSGSVEAAIEIGYNYYSILGEVESSQNGHVSVRAPLLSAGVRLWSKLATWLYADLEFHLGLLTLNSDVSSQYSEWSIDLQVNPIEELFVGAGYRRIDLDLDDDRHGSNDSRKFDGTIDGFFLSISYHF